MKHKTDLYRGNASPDEVRDAITELLRNYEAAAQVLPVSWIAPPIPLAPARAEPFTPGPNSYDPGMAANTPRFNLGSSEPVKPKGRPGWIGGWL
jgi:hypothetical protein